MTELEHDRVRLREGLTIACDKRGFVLALAAEAAGTELARWGEPSQLKWQGLVHSLFGDAEAIRRTLAALEVGEARVLAQGAVRCTYMRPTADVLVGLFSQDARGAVELMETAALICGELAQLLVAAEGKRE